MKVKTVVRKIKSTYCDVLVVNMKTNKTLVKTYKLIGVYHTDKQILRDVDREYNLIKQDLKPVFVQTSEVKTERYALPETTFIEQGTLLN